MSHTHAPRTAELKLSRRTPHILTHIVCGLVLALGIFAAPARADLAVYTDSLQSGFQDWSWATHDMTNTSPVQAGSDSISVTFGAYTGLYFEHSAFDARPYSALTFWIDGGATGGQQFTVRAFTASGAMLPSLPVTNYVAGGTIPANQWVQVTIPLADLQAATLTDFEGFWFQDSTGGAQPTLFVDSVTMLSRPVPSVVHVTVNANQTLQTVDDREFGVNTDIWDGSLGTSATQSLMSAVGARVLRFPGGSASDAYDWTDLQNTTEPTTPTFGALTDATGTQGIITVNYGTGSPQMAAAWVAYCNAATTNAVAISLDPAGRDWKTASYWAALRGASPITPDDGLNFLRAGHAAPYAVKNWEIGNECYGSWENDTHSAKQDPVIYANFAKTATTLMKQVDPTIQTGVVVTSTEDDSGNQMETVTNPVTNVQHKGWTAVLFSTLNSINYTPDFVIYHNYAQQPGTESDVLLLQYAPTWTGISQSIRTMLTQYLGASPSANCRMICTENNSVSSSPGKQSTSLVNGLFCADSLGSLMQTEFKGLVWWVFRNGGDNSQNNAASLYGWRLYGDYGIVGASGTQPGGDVNTPYPTYFALKLAQHFARGGDMIVSSVSDYSGLSAYAARRANGGLSLLVINKNPTVSLNTNIALTGYTPVGTATTYTYGETEDTQQSTGATVDLTQSALSGVASTFSATFTPYSMTVVDLLPTSPVPTITSLSPTSGPIGTVLTITGTNLNGVTAVRFHNASAKTFSSNAGGTQLTVTVPSGAATGTVTVTTPTGSAKTAANFTVTPPPTITSFSPASGPVGTIITIIGTGLSGVTAVRFHNASAKVFSANAAGTQLTVTVPAGAATGTMTITTPGGSVKTATNFTVH